MTEKTPTKIDFQANWRKVSERFPHTKEAGGAVLEYVLVSAFAAAVGMAALGFVGKMVKQHLQTMSERFGASENPEVDLPWAPPS